MYTGRSHLSVFFNGHIRGLHDMTIFMTFIGNRTGTFTFQRGPLHIGLTMFILRIFEINQTFIILCISQSPNCEITTMVLCVRSSSKNLRHDFHRVYKVLLYLIYHFLQHFPILRQTAQGGGTHNNYTNSYTYWGFFFFRGGAPPTVVFYKEEGGGYKVF